MGSHASAFRGQMAVFSVDRHDPDPDSITLLPTYMFYLNLSYLAAAPGLAAIPLSLPWNWLPLIAPHFFSSAIFVFLLRQNFLSIPRDLDEAAMLDGAGPLRILAQIILPQSIPVVATVAMLHFFYIWNEFRLSSLYLGLNTTFGCSRRVCNMLRRCPASIPSRGAIRRPAADDRAGDRLAGLPALLYARHGCHRHGEITDEQNDKSCATLCCSGWPGC
jgi:hypothetical protein